MGKKYRDDDINEETLSDEIEKLYKSVNKKAYSAEGHVQIKLSTFLNNNGLFDPQKNGSHFDPW